MSGRSDAVAAQDDSVGRPAGPLDRHVRARRSPAGDAAVFVGEEGLLQDPMPWPADVNKLCWRPQSLAALYALQAHGYTLLLFSGFAGGAPWPPGRSAAFNRALLTRVKEEADVRLAGILAHAGPRELPASLRLAADEHGLDLHRAWFLSCEDDLGNASRRLGCRALRLLEPGRQTHRRWPLLRGQSRMKLMEAASYILRCDGHLVAARTLPAPEAQDAQEPGTGAPQGSDPKARTRVVSA